MLVRQIARVSSIAGALGPANGLRACWAFYWPRLVGRNRAALRRFPVPASDGWVWLRPGGSDWHVYEQIFIRRDYDLEKCGQSNRLMEKYRRQLELKHRPVIVDCGANIGLSTVWFKMYFPESVIYAIEPDAENFSILKRNVAALSEVFPIHGGVWDCPASLYISNPTAEAWLFRLTDEQNESSTPRVRGITIPEILTQGGHERPFIVKVDIEGGESQLFRSNVEWLDETELVIIELHDWMLPWRGTSSTFFGAASRRTRDYIFSEENLFCFLHSSEMN